MGINMPIDTQKKEFLNWRFVHEVRMLRSVNGFRNQLPTVGAQLRQTRNEYNFLSTVVVVNLLLHARNLREFFFGSSYPQTAEAGDYISWTTPTETANTIELKNRVNHEIMHMDLGSSGQIYDITVRWQDMDGLVRDLQNIAKEFLNKLEQEEPDYFDTNLRALKFDFDR